MSYLPLFFNADYANLSIMKFEFQNSIMLAVASVLLRFADWHPNGAFIIGASHIACDVDLQHGIAT